MGLVESVKLMSQLLVMLAQGQVVLGPPAPVEVPEIPKDEGINGAGANENDNKEQESEVA